MCVYMEVAIWVVRIMEMAEMLWGSRWLLNIGFARRDSCASYCMEIFLRRNHFLFMTATLLPAGLCELLYGDRGVFLQLLD